MWEGVAGPYTRILPVTEMVRESRTLWLVVRDVKVGGYEACLRSDGIFLGKQKTRPEKSRQSAEAGCMGKVRRQSITKGRKNGIH